MIRDGFKDTTIKDIIILQAIIYVVDSDLAKL